jgi:hypothetical protein
MSFGDYLYIVAAILFAYMTFVIVRNYYSSKFNDKGQRMDMLDEYEEKEDEPPAK